MRRSQKIHNDVICTVVSIQKSGWIRLDKEVKKVTNLSVRTRASVLLQFRFFVALQVLGLVRTSGFDFF